MVRSGGHVEEGLGGGLDWGSGGQLDRLKVQAGEDKEVGGGRWDGEGSFSLCSVIQQETPSFAPSQACTGSSYSEITPFNPVNT